MLSIIENLPRDSHYVQALSLDAELAEQTIDAPPPDDSERRLSMGDYSPEIEVLTGIYDKLQEVVAAVICTIPQAKPPRVRPWPRPRTAVDELRSARRVTAHRSLVARVLPNQ